jgi:hypothetical protein
MDEPLLDDESPPETLAVRVNRFATEVGGKIDTSSYDCGTQYRLTLPGKGTVSVSVDCGDDIDIVAALRTQLMERGFDQRKRAFRLEYASGQTITVQALDATQAVRLAGRGQPEQITDLSGVDAWIDTWR